MSHEDPIRSGSVVEQPRVSFIAKLRTMGSTALKRVRGAIGLSMISAAGVAVVGTVLGTVVASVINRSPTFSLIPSFAAWFGMLGFLSGALASIAIVVSSRSKLGSPLTAFAVGAVGSSSLYFALVLRQVWTMPEIEVRWGGTLIMIAVLGGIVRAVAGGFLRIARSGGSTPDDGESRPSHPALELGEV